MIGDDDAEDAYDAGDPPALKLAVLARWIPALEDEIGPPPWTYDRRRVEARIAAAVATAAHIFTLPLAPAGEAQLAGLTARIQRLDDDFGKSVPDG